MKTEGGKEKGEETHGLKKEERRDEKQQIEAEGTDVDQGVKHSLADLLKVDASLKSACAELKRRQESTLTDGDSSGILSGR